MKKNLVAYNFNKHSVTYDNYAIAQKTISFELIKNILQERDVFLNVLEIGCGTGFFTTELFHKLQIGKIFLNDISHQMINQTKKKLSKEDIEKTEILEGDFEKIRITNSYDLVTSSAVFQWFTEEEYSFKKIFNILDKGGLFCFALFINGTFWELSKAITATFVELQLPPQDVIINFKDEEYYLNLLTDNKFVIKNKTNGEIVLKYNHPYDFLRSLQKIGATGFKEKKLSIKFIKKMIANYTEFFCGNEIDVTYKILYIIAKKGE